MLKLITPGARVLETGCANGRFSAVLHEIGCKVTGVEIDAGAAQQAEQFCEQVSVGNLEDAHVRDRIPGDFDIMIFGDVLEHLVEPWKVLSDLRSHLNPSGYIVVSIPNIAHWDGRMGLLVGRFDYTRDGLLDATHLRFFTQRTAKELIEQSGYHIVELGRTYSLPRWVYRIRLVRRFAPMLLLPVLARLFPNLFTLQFIIKAIPRQQA
jgi:2-polyprenyl-3-methyl-5-hydroxy-6-metoxy-1,4-benzoquinol methylase